MQTLAVRRAQGGPFSQLADHRNAPAVIADELQGVEAPASQEVDAGIEQAIRFRMLGCPAELVHHARRNALEGGVQQEQALVQGQAHGPGGLLQPALALASELTRDVAVRERCDEGDRQHRAAHEKQEEPSPEPALQRCRS